MKRDVYFPFLRHLPHEQIECSVQEHPDKWKTLKIGRRDRQVE